MNLKLKKKTKVISIVVIIIVIMLLYSFGLLNFKTSSITGNPSDEYIQTPFIGHYQCLPRVGGVLPSGTVDINNEPNNVYQPVYLPKYTDSGQVILQAEPSSQSILGKRFKYQFCNLDNTCSSEIEAIVDNQWDFSDNRYSLTIPEQLTKFKKLNVKYERCIGVFAFGVCAGVWDSGSGARYYVYYTPYILWKDSPTEGLKPYSSISQGCAFNSTITPKLFESSSSAKINSGISETSSSNVELQVNEVRNFVDVLVPLNQDNINFVTYNGQLTYCQGRQLWSVDTVTTNRGTSKVVNTNYNTIVKTGLDCCPGEKEPLRKCNSNFIWEPIGQASCDPYYNPCQGLDWQPSGSPKTLIRYNCINSKCEGETKLVECTNDLDCIGNPKGGACDTYTYTCSDVTPPISNGSCQPSCKMDSDCFNCGSNYKCDGEQNLIVYIIPGTCKKVTSPSGLLPCKTCGEWLFSKFKPASDKCESKSVINPKFSWNPFSWITGGVTWIINQTGITNQSLLCPFYLFILTIIGFIVVFLLMILIGFGFSLKKLSDKLIRKIK